MNVDVPLDQFIGYSDPGILDRLYNFVPPDTAQHGTYEDLLRVAPTPAYLAQQAAKSAIGVLSPLFPPTEVVEISPEPTPEPTPESSPESSPRTDE